MVFNFDTTRSLAVSLDAEDQLSHWKAAFHFPENNGSNVIYFCGNSLGLQPVTVKAAIETELETWQNMAIGGYFGGTNPWLYYHDYCKPALTAMMGCSADEITVMNALTVNLHLMMQTFYRPTKSRYKIVMEAGAFPSDQYAVETQVKQYSRFLGIDADEAIIEIHPRQGEKLLRTEDIIETIELNRDSLALVLFSGMNYYTGQLFDIQSIVSATHNAGAYAGFDLAHVAGNVPMKLHEWNADFAVWCSYKYLNAGPGAAGGVFIHQQHISNTSLPRFGGWWGNSEQLRFKMEKGFEPKPDANGWCLSTSQVFNMVALKASLEIFNQAGIQNIRNKSILLTGYLEYLLQQLTNLDFEIITPADPAYRGAQLSLYFRQKGREIHDKMIASGIVVDYREPGVIRVAPAPLFCSFGDVYRFYEILKENF